MTRRLSDTLIDFLDGIASAPRAGLEITEALLDVPLEITADVVDGQLGVMARPPFTRWQSGVLPHVQRCRLRVALDEDDADDEGGGGGW